MGVLVLWMLNAECLCGCAGGVLGSWMGVGDGLRSVAARNGDPDMADTQTARDWRLTEIQRSLSMRLHCKENI